MKICFVGKYPPVEGGESSKLYWLARELGKRGHEVHIVTNSLCVEKEYREIFTGSDLGFYQPSGVKVHNLNPFSLPSFVLHSPSYAQRLASLALRVIEKYKIEVIEGWYLVPYGTAAFLAASLTGIPLVIRHAGSDLNKLAVNENFKDLAESVLKRADRVITFPSRKSFLVERGVAPYNLFINRSLSVDTEFFSPENRISVSDYLPKELFETKDPIFCYLGKISENKGLVELVNALGKCKKRKKKFVLLIIGDGKSLFKEKLKREIVNLGLEKNVFFVPFVPPWRVPGIINLVDLVVCLENGFPIEVHSPLLIREVMACGKCLLLSKELYQKQPREIVKDRENVLVVDPKNEKELEKIIDEVLADKSLREKIGKKARKAALKREDFSHYVDDFEKMYEEVGGGWSSSQKKKYLILLRGAPGAGKTTVSREVKKIKPEIAVIKIDTLRRILSDDPDPFDKKLLNLKMVEKISEFLLGKGISVVLDGIFNYEAEIEPFCVLARKFKAIFKIVELTAPLEVLKKRVSLKPKDPLSGGVVNFDLAYKNYLRSRINEDKYPLILINTENLSPEEVAKELIEKVFKET